MVVVEDGEAVVCCGASSGQEPVFTGEAKPGVLRRSNTLPCFRVLAGLKRPSETSVLLLVAGLTAATLGLASFPLDIEGPFATGALKVNPADGEKEGVLAGVALTIGEENVKGTEGEDEAGVVSLGLTSSFAGVTVTLGVLLMVEASRGEVKLKVGKAVVLLMGREMGGRSGNSGTSSSCRFEDTRVEDLSRFILPPPKVTLLAAGVLDKG